MTHRLFGALAPAAIAALAGNALADFAVDGSATDLPAGATPVSSAPGIDIFAATDLDAGTLHLWGVTTDTSADAGFDIFDVNLGIDGNAAPWRYRIRSKNNPFSQTDIGAGDGPEALPLNYEALYGEGDDSAAAGNGSIPANLSDGNAFPDGVQWDVSDADGVRVHEIAFPLDLILDGNNGWDPNAGQITFAIAGFYGANGTGFTAIPASVDVADQSTYDTFTLPVTAKTSNTTFRDTLDTPFIPGNGNTNTDFAITRTTENTGDSAGNTIELALKAKERFFGQSNVGGSDNLYIVETGFSPVSGAPGAPDDPSRAWWNFDFSVDYGDLRDNTDTLVTLTVQDIEGDSVTLPFNPAQPDFPAGSQLAQGSFNTGFDFLANPLNGFDPSGQGDYTITLNATDVVTAHHLGSVSITVRVESPVQPCPPDLDGNGVVEAADAGVFVTLFLAGDPAADFDGNGFVEAADAAAFVAAFNAGCPN